MEPILKTYTETSTCKNCGSDKVDEYCSSCGQRNYPSRFTLKSSLLMLLSAFNLERGFFYTLKKLFVDPAKVVNDYIGRRTKVYFNPLNYFLIIAGINALLIVWFGVFDANLANTSELMGQEPGKVILMKGFVSIIKQYTNIFSLLVIPFISLVSKWYYSKQKLFYGEHLILNCFLHAQVTVIGIISFPLYKIIPALYDHVVLYRFLVAAAYYSFALKGIFKKSLFKSVVGGMLINFGGQILFMLFMGIIFGVVAVIFKLTGHSLKEGFIGI